MELGIENFAGVIIENPKGEILLVRKAKHYAYAIPWCRIEAGRNIRDCLREKVHSLTGLSVHPAFMGPSEHIEGNSHFISFDHLARIDVDKHHYTREDLDYLWVLPGGINAVPLVPLTRSILEQYCRENGIDIE